jgi:hypothetical protein
MKKRIDQLAMLHLLANTASERPRLSGVPSSSSLGTSTNGEAQEKGSKEEEEEELRQLVRGSAGLISLREIGARVTGRGEEERVEADGDGDEKENDKAKVVQRIHRKLWSWMDDAQQHHQSRPVQTAS